MAGIELNGTSKGCWVRPVSARNGHEVSLAERLLSDGTDPVPLDIIQVPLLSAEPRMHQKENWVLDPDQEWVKAGQWPWADIRLLEDNPEDLWGTGESSGGGLNDRVHMSTASAAISDSLLLVGTSDLRLRVQSGWNGGAPRVRALFRYADEEYNLRVTDDVACSAFVKRGYGAYPIGEAHLTVSLGEPSPHDGYIYKLVAAVLGSGAPLEGLP